MSSLAPTITAWERLWLFPGDSWRTPLGAVETDLEMADALAGTIIDQEESAHLQEHSIEIQLPFSSVQIRWFQDPGQ